MKKRMIILSVLLCVLFISGAYASATYTTSKTGSSQGYTVTARAYWVYETGRYSSKGPHTVNQRPSNTLTKIHNLDYVLSHVPSDRNSVTQYFRPAYYNPLIDHTTYGNNFGITLSTSGPRSIDF